MILSNKEKIRKCIILENQRYFKLYPSKQPFFNFESKSEYRKKAIAERERLMLARLEEFTKSNEVTLRSLIREFECDEELLLEWIKALSSKPEFAEEQFKRIYAECTEGLKNAIKKDTLTRPHVRISYVPVLRMVINKLHEIDIGIE